MEWLKYISKGGDTMAQNGNQTSNMVENANTQYVQAQNLKGERTSVKVTKGGDLRAR